MKFLLYFLFEVITLILYLLDFVIIFFIYLILSMTRKNLTANYPFI